MADLQQGAKKLNAVEIPSESKTNKQSGVHTDDETHRALGETLLSVHHSKYVIC